MDPERTPNTLTGRNAIVTGASRGIGRAIAEGLAERGAHVLVHYNVDAEAAAACLESLPGGPHLAVPADLADPEACASLAAVAAAEFGSIDILVNNAGIYELQDPGNTNYADWQRVWNRTLATNLSGPANLIFSALSHMKEGGRIVNVSSRGAFRGEPNAPAYGASKAGLNSLGQSLAQALAPRGIGVFTVAPGFVATDMAADLLDGPGGAAIKAQSPLGRVAEPEEIAGLVVYLASEASIMQTGCIVDCNGASYLRT